jgi:hypothetical protein
MLYHLVEHNQVKNLIRHRQLTVRKIRRTNRDSFGVEKRPQRLVLQNKMNITRGHPMTKPLQRNRDHPSETPDFHNSQPTTTRGNVFYPPPECMPQLTIHRAAFSNDRFRLDD